MTDQTARPHARPAHPQTQWTWVRSKETGHHYAAPYPADRLPDHLEALDEPALDRNGRPRKAKPNQSIKYRNPTTSRPGMSPVAADTPPPGQADQAEVSTPEANKEADPS